MVDVHVGVLGEARVDAVDERLERAPARSRGRRPRAASKSSSASSTPQRYSRLPCSSQNGLPSMSKKRSPGEGSGRSAKPRVGVRRRAARRRARRSRGAASWSRACRWSLAKRSALRPAGSVGVREPGEGGDPGRLELRRSRGGRRRRRGRGCRSRPTRRRRAAGSRRSRSGRRGRASSRGRSATNSSSRALHAARVGGELLRAEALPLAGAEQHVDPRRLAPLDARELLAVEAELEDVGGLRAAGELRVDRLVGAVGLPLEEVGLTPRQRAVGEDALVDDVDAGADRLLGLARRALPVEVGLERDLDDASCPRRAGARGTPPRARAPCGRRARPARSRARGFSSSPRATWSESVVRCSQPR